ncbi:MAG: bifunctional metallophosphatase/5'-nucleotidase [Planctomycetes bacterium]|nr:bifunctional metallophosphatase/5'-nucleotidase [Planctomycetota bacterium]
MALPHRTPGVGLTLALLLTLACSAAPADDGPAPAAPPPPTPTPTPTPTPAASDARVHLTIVHTNDLHAHLENFAAVSQIEKNQRARSKNTLLLDGGDCITGTAVSTVFQGTPIFEVMNLMGYDAGTIGNHEFDHGWKKVHEFVDVAKHPVLCANAKDPDGKPFGDAPWKLLELGGVKIGVIGMITENVPTLTTAKASAGCTFEPYIDAARRLVPEVRKQADIVVLLTHCGVEADAAVAGSVTGIDLIVGGHSHTKLDRALVSPNGTRTVQAWEYGKAVGIIDFDWDLKEKRIEDFKYRLEQVEGRDLPKDPVVQKAVDAWQAKVASLDEVIGKTQAALSKKLLRPLLERIYKEALGADFGFQNTGGIRETIKAGDISVTDIVAVLPFDNTLVKIRLKGDQVPEFNRRELGDKFDPAKEYVFATNSYVGDQREKYFRAKDAPVEDMKVSMREAVVQWVRKHGGFIESGKPLPEPDDRTDPR